MSEQNPSWVDTAEYPFAPRFLAMDEGRLHYIDEGHRGHGETILMVHGTPTWSFLYRRQVRALSRRFRCLAVDHLGFGLSDKPADAAYRPEDHARRLEQFIETLDLRAITLVVHDFGGPIGLSYALDHPQRVKRIVLFNTWMWSLAGDPRARMADRLVRGTLGDFLYRKLNASPRFLMPRAFYDKARLPPALHQQYLAPFAASSSRTSLLALARALVGSARWYETLWERRDVLRAVPALLLWGMRDITFRPADLQRWQTVFANSETIRFSDAGHFVQEEADTNLLNQTVERFIDGNP
jgi:haloalkane dehalogenase